VRAHGARGGRGVRAHGARGGARARGVAHNRDNDWTWSKIDEAHPNDVSEMLSLFSEIEGLLVRIGDNPTVLHFVRLYLTDEIMTHIVSEISL